MKSFRYENGSDFRIIGEATIRQQIASGSMTPLEIANAEEVLALEINASTRFESGAVFTRVADDSEPMTVIICRGRSTSKPCEFCRTTVRGGGLLCDGPGKKQGKTCDAFMCAKCARRIGKNRDLCPKCAAATEVQG
jgi:hypothetical protein